MKIKPLVCGAVLFAICLNGESKPSLIKTKNPPVHRMHGLLLTAKTIDSTKLILHISNSGEDSVKLWKFSSPYGKMHIKLEVMNSKKSTYVLYRRPPLGSTFGSEVLEIKPGATVDQELPLNDEDWVRPENFPESIRDCRCRFWYVTANASFFAESSSESGVTEDSFASDWVAVDEVRASRQK